MKVAACEYPVGCPATFEEWHEKVAAMTAAACARGASLLVYPEYGAMELAALFPEDIRSSLVVQLPALQNLRDRFLEVFASLSRRLNATILAPSFPWLLEDGRYVNRSWLFVPDGAPRFQDKLMMTRFEAEEWGISASDELKVFDIPGARIGICICYDSEFPLLARRQVEAGADIILVPSCTDTMAGYHRVMLSCRARALENQCFVVQSPTAGEAPWSPAIDINTGKAGFFAPVDRGFPDDGVLACGAPADTAPWLIAELPVARIASVRRHGQVKNFADWPRHEGIAPPQ
jgi:predicted amidohydrolase